MRLSLGSELPEGCQLIGPSPQSREGTVAKYGLLDLRFSAPAELLVGDVRTGVPLLRELGFLPGGEAGPQHRVCDDPICLEMLQDDIEEGRAWLKLFLEGGKPGDEARIEEPLGHVSLRTPSAYCPRSFRVLDACVSNAASVWVWKPFYL